MLLYEGRCIQLREDGAVTPTGRRRKNVYYVTKGSNPTYYIFGERGKVTDGQALMYDPASDTYKDVGSVQEIRERIGKLVQGKVTGIDYNYAVSLNAITFLQAVLAGMVSREDLDKSEIHESRQSGAMLDVHTSLEDFGIRAGVLCFLRISVSPADYDLWADYKRKVLPTLK